MVRVDRCPRRRATLQGRVFADVVRAQQELDAWVASYNPERPHQSKDMRTPADVFTTSKAQLSLVPDREADDSALSPLDRGGNDWIARRVSNVGVVCVAWQQISVGKHRSGSTVDVQVGEEILHIWDGNELLKTALRDNRKEIRKKRASIAS